VACRKGAQLFVARPEVETGGLTPKLPAAEKQRIIRDVLIARTARRAGALLVTDNLKDFKLIARFCAVRAMAGRRYFKRS
jgi:predicted nucleic acid-binding protein